MNFKEQMAVKVAEIEEILKTYMISESTFYRRLREQRLQKKGRK